MSNIKFYISKAMKYALNPPAIKNSRINKLSRICPGSEIYNTVLDRYSYIGSRCFIVNAYIGSFTSIADRCCIGGAMHTVDWVSTSPVFSKGKNILKKNFASFNRPTTLKTCIGNDVWIGMGCYIKAGVQIGDGAVLGMGSVLTKNIPPYEIWAGNPAKKIRDRFKDEQKRQFANIKWWEWNELKIQENSSMFNDVDKFILNNLKEDE